MIPLMLLFFYRVVYVVSLAMIHVFQWILPQKIRALIKDRSLPLVNSLIARPIWIHAASGEIEYAKPILKEIRKKYPQVPILLTYFSSSAKRLFYQVEADQVIALPWDLPWTMQSFLKKFKPQKLYIARSDLWPELLYQGRKNQLEMEIFSYTCAKKLTGLKKIWLHGLMTFLNRVYVVSEEDLQNLNLSEKEHASGKFQISGDTRFDQVMSRIQQPKTLPISLNPQGQERIFVCGSTWPEDESVLIPCLDLFPQNGWRVVIAPHEVGQDHLSTIVDKVCESKLTYRFYSQFQGWSSECQVVILDQIGILPEIYLQAQAAFVGGSFRSKVHSVMEPLAAGLPVLVGPRIQNNREAMVFKRNYLSEDLTAVSVASNRSECIAWIKKVVKKTDMEKLQSSLKHAVFKQSGVSQKIVSRLELNP